MEDSLKFMKISGFLKKNPLLRTLGIIILLSGIYFSYRGLEWIPNIIVGLALIFFTMFDSFEQLTLGLNGFSVVKKTESLIEETKNLAYNLAFSNLIMLMNLDKIPYEKEEDIKNLVINSLKELQIEEEKIFKINEQLNTYTLKRYILYITYSISEIQNNNLSIPNEWANLIAGNDFKKATPTAMLQILKNLSISNQEIIESIKDYEYYLANRTHRRPEKWKECKWRTIIAASQLNLLEKKGPKQI